MVDTDDGSNNVGFSGMPVARFLRVPSPRSASTVIMKHTVTTGYYTRRRVGTGTLAV